MGNYAVLYFAYDFDIGAYFTLSGVEFAIDRTDPLWTYDAEVTILLSRPLFSLIIGVVSLLVLILSRKLHTATFFFLLWMNIFAFNAAFGLFLDDFISRTGVFYVARRMDFDTPEIIVSLAISVFIMYRLGMVNSLVFGQLLPQKCSSSNKQKYSYLSFTLVLPWLLTGLLIILITYPIEMFSEHLKTLSTIVIIVPMFFCKRRKSSDTLLNIKSIGRLDWIIAILFILFSAILYLVMVNPVLILQ